MKGEFSPVGDYKDKDGNYNTGCRWLGFEYYKSVNYKPFPVKDVINGILAE